MLPLITLTADAPPLTTVTTVFVPTTESWDLTRVIHALRLTIADACLRARDDAQSYKKTSAEHWYALGRAQGYQKSAALLRRWQHPDERENALNAIEALGVTAAHRASKATSGSDVAYYYEAYVWSLTWVAMQIRELCAAHEKWA